MNKFIDKLLKKDGQESSPQEGKDKKIKTINIVLAVVLAVSLWAYVIGEVNPETEKTLTGVPLNITGMNVLETKDLVVLTEFSDTITAVIRGRRSEIYPITADKLSARIDLSECIEGENQVSVKVTAPSNVSEAEAREADLVVVVDRLVSEEKPVEINVKDQTGGDIVTEVNAIDAETVLVSGPSTYVDRVASVTGVLNPKNKDEYSQMVTLVPIDSEGNEVSGVELENNTVTVDAVRTQVKTVQVNIILDGEAPDGINVNLADDVKVRIKGNKNLIDSVDELRSAPVNISQITENTTVDIQVLLPDGVTAVDGFGKMLSNQSQGILSVKAHLIVDAIDEEPQTEPDAEPNVKSETKTEE